MKINILNDDRWLLSFESYKRRIRYKIRQHKIIRIIDDGIQLLAELIIHRTILKSFVDHFREGSKRNLWIDSINCGFRYGTTIGEYFTFGFYEKDEEERAKWLSNKVRRYSVVNMWELEHPELLWVCSDKYRSYEMLKKYYKRKIMLLDSKANVENILDEFDGKEIVVKPRFGTDGKDIVFYSAKNNKQRFIELFTAWL